MRIEFFEIPKKGAKAKKKMGNYKKSLLETRKSQLGGIYTRFCQYTAKISSEMDSSSQKHRFT